MRTAVRCAYVAADIEETLSGEAKVLQFMHKRLSSARSPIQSRLASSSTAHSHVGGLLEDYNFAGHKYIFYLTKSFTENIGRGGKGWVDTLIASVATNAVKFLPGWGRIAIAALVAGIASSIRSTAAKASSKRRSIRITFYCPAPSPFPVLVKAWIN